jgi:hypothetical protein
VQAQSTTKIATYRRQRTTPSRSGQRHSQRIILSSENKRTLSFAGESVPGTTRRGCNYELMSGANYEVMSGAQRNDRGTGGVTGRGFMLGRSGMVADQPTGSAS